MSTILQFLTMGGLLYMSLITLTLVGIFFSAWKKPCVIRPLSNMVLAFGIMSFCIDWYHCFETYVEVRGEISNTVLLAGAKITLIAPMYALVVFIIAQIITMIKSK